MADDMARQEIENQLQAAAMSQVEKAEDMARQNGVDLPPRDGASGSPSLDDDTLVTLESGDKVTVGQLKKERMLHADYTRKTQDLSQKEKDYQKQLEERDYYIGLMNQYWKDNPEEYQKMVSHFEGNNTDSQAPTHGGNGNGQKPQQAQPSTFHNRKYEEEIEKANRDIAAMRKRIEDREVSDGISRFKAEHPEVTDEMLSDVIDKATAPGAYDQSKDTFGNLTSAYSSLQKWSEIGRKTVEQEREEKLKAQFAGGGTQSGAGGGLTYAEALRRSSAFKPEASRIFGG